MNIKFHIFYLGIFLFATISFAKSKQLSNSDKGVNAESHQDSLIREKQLQWPDTTISLRPFMILNTKKHSYSIDRIILSEQKFPHINSVKVLFARIPGVEVSETNGDMASTVLVKIRGSNSYLGKKAPLYVVDGVQLNYRNNGISNIFNASPVDFGDNTLDINIEDIKDITVLKGGIATVIYGSEAADGVILINTKTAQKKGLNVSFHSSAIFDKVYKMPEFQNEFGSGSNGLYDMSRSSAFGPSLDGGNMAIQFDGPVDQAGNPIATLLNSYPENQNDFFQTGTTFNNVISVSSKGNALEGGVSIGDTRNKGVIPNTDFRRNTINSYGVFRPFEKLELSANIAYSKISSDNRPSGGRRSTNPVSAVYHIPPNVSISELKDYWIEGQENYQQRNYRANVDNPWFTLNENKNGLNRNRFRGNFGMRYSIIDGLDVFGRYAFDSYSEKRERKKAFSSYRYNSGAYGIENISQRNSDINFGINLNKRFNKVYITSTLNADLLYFNDSTLMKFRNQLDAPLEYNFDNEFLTNTFSSKSNRHRFSWLNEIGFNDLVYLDFAIGRELTKNSQISVYNQFSVGNNGSSINANYDNGEPYNSLSIGTTVVISNIINFPSWIDRLSYMANWTKISGIDNFPVITNSLISPDLKQPTKEIIETGIDIGAFDNRLNLSVSYYNNMSKDLLLAIKLSPNTGFSSRYINALDISEKGLEMQLSITPIQNETFSWDLGVNYFQNKIKAEYILDDMYLNIWNESNIINRWNMGETIDNLYSTQYLTFEDKDSPYFGYVLLDDEGYPKSNMVNDRLLGNINHDFSMGFNSNFRYKNFSLSVLFDWRQGGVFISNTMRYLTSDGLLKSTLEGSNKKDIFQNESIWVGGRDETHGGLPWLGGNPWTPDNLNNASFIPGVFEDDEGNYVLNDGNPETTIFITPEEAVYNTNWNYPDNWMYSASFIKLREVAISYVFPSKITENIFIERMRFSIVGSNFLLWSEAGKAGIDPEHNYFIGGGKFNRGMENYSTPPVTSWGFKLNIEI